jgi:hypothetical protein
MKYLKTLMGSAIAALALATGAQAANIDLTTAGSSGTINGATYTQVDALPTGSGYIDSFVRIRDNQTVVQGYNTTVSNVYQNDGTDTFNHQVTVGQIGFIDINGDTAGGVVMRFLLDINQTASNPFLLMSEVQIFLSTNPNQSIEPVLGQGTLLPLDASALVYQMDGAGDTGADLNYWLNHGSGSGDMTLDIPIEMFAGAFASLGLTTADMQNGAFLYLYSKFEGNNDGYEEWTHFQGNGVGEPPCDPRIQDCGPREIPEPGSLFLFSLGLLGSAIVIKRRRWTK